MIINNVRLVLENEVVNGSVEVRDGVIRAFAETQSRSPDAMDGEGGWLLPGLIELHTDNLDKFSRPPEGRLACSFSDEQPRRADGRQRHHHGAGRGGDRRRARRRRSAGEHGR